MAVKSFIRGDFRTRIVDNDYPTNDKVYYNGKWNYIQDEESFINRLNPNLGESYLNRFNLKVLDHNQWISLAILENYYNKNEKRNSIFYRTITRENFIFKPRAVNFTEVDARLGLNNLQTPFVSNETKSEKEEIEEITDRIQKDEILYKLGNVEIYNELDTINYKLSEKDNFESNTNTNFLEDKAELDYYYLTSYAENIDLYNNVIINSDMIEVINNEIVFKKDPSNIVKIKEILINNWYGTNGCNNVNAGGIFRFYNLDGNLIESGNVISYNSTNAETENFLIECNSTWTSSGNIDYLGPQNAFRTDLTVDCNPSGGHVYVSRSSNSDEYIKLIFKTPQYISKIESNLHAKDNAYTYGTNINNCTITLFYEDIDGNINQNSEKIIINQSGAYNEITETTGLIQSYNTTEYQTFKINNTFNIDDFLSFSIYGDRLNSIDDCNLKFLISFDNINFYSFKDLTWNLIDSKNINLYGMTLEEFRNIKKENLVSQFKDLLNVHIYVGILNKHVLINSPKIKLMTINYLKKNKNNIILCDQILINNFTTYNQNAGGVFRFYDENGDLIESGKILHYTGTYAESENFIMESYDYWTFSGTVDTLGIMNAFRTDLEKSAIPISDNMYISNPLTNNDQYALVKFKTLKKVSKIECNIRSRYANYSNAKSCTINLMLNDEIIKSFDIETDTQFNIIQTLENFNDMLYYDNSIGIIKTNTNQIQNIDKIEKIQIIADELKDTKVKVALSVDSKNTYLKFDGTNWNTIQENDVINIGNTIDEINSLTYKDFSYLNLTNKTLDFIICMETSDVAITPNIKKIIVTSINKQ